MLEHITPLILTLNEAPNVERTLAGLEWAGDIVVVDSGSTDGTLEVLAGIDRVRVFHREFVSHTSQWQFGLEETGIQTEWVLTLDADYQLTEPVTAELAALHPPPAVCGYRAGFTYCVFGRPLRGALYPPRVVLFRKAAGRFVPDGHTQRTVIEGEVLNLDQRIRHDDRKPVVRWVEAQRRYAGLEADKLTTSGPLSFPDRLRRRIWLVPWLTLPYCLIWKRNLLDGWPGWFYAFQRLVAECLLSLTLLERRLRGKSGSE